MAEKDRNLEGYIDSHAHLADPAFDGDRSDVIQRARESGAAAIVFIGNPPFEPAAMVPASG